MLLGLLFAAVIVISARENIKLPYATNTGNIEEFNILFKNDTITQEHIPHNIYKGVRSRRNLRKRFGFQEDRSITLDNAKKNGDLFKYHNNTKTDLDNTRTQDGHLVSRKTPQNTNIRARTYIYKLEDHFNTAVKAIICIANNQIPLDKIELLHELLENLLKMLSKNKRAGFITLTKTQQENQDLLESFYQSGSIACKKGFLSIENFYNKYEITLLNDMYNKYIIFALRLHETHANAKKQEERIFQNMKTQMILSTIITKRLYHNYPLKCGNLNISYKELVTYLNLTLHNTNQLQRIMREVLKDGLRSEEYAREFLKYLHKINEFYQVNWDYIAGFHEYFAKIHEMSRK